MDKVYLEYFRSDDWCTKEHMLEVKDYFNKKGIRADLLYNEEVTLEMVNKESKVTELKSGREYKPDSNGRLPLMLMPYNNMLLLIK